MRRAIDETDRRRARQEDFNREHGITPQGIRKAVMDIMEGAHAESPGQRRLARVAEADAAPYLVLAPEALAKKLREMEEQMYRHARDLEFEEAARLRDEIRRVQSLGLEIPDTPAPARRRAGRRK
jgi:excinuclease ABC subunit B